MCLLDRRSNFSLPALAESHLTCERRMWGQNICNLKERNYWSTAVCMNSDLARCDGAHGRRGLPNPVPAHTCSCLRSSTRPPAPEPRQAMEPALRRTRVSLPIQFGDRRPCCNPRTRATRPMGCLCRASRISSHRLLPTRPRAFQRSGFHCACISSTERAGGRPDGVISVTAWRQDTA